MADQVGRLASKEGLAFIAVGGDTRALQMMEEALPADLVGRLRRLSGGRSDDGFEDVVNEEVEALLEAEVSSAEDSVLSALAESAGQNLAVRGPAETMGALSAGRLRYRRRRVCRRGPGQVPGWHRRPAPLDRAGLTGSCMYFCRPRRPL